MTLATLTDGGFAVLEATAPGHVATVRRVVFDGLAPSEVADLERVCVAILANLDDAPG